MSRLIFNRDGGSANEYGHLLALSRLLTGDVIEGMAVTANGTPNMTVNVGPGSCRIGTGTYPTSYGYFAAVDTTSPGESVTIATANSSNPRNDLIVAYVDKSLTPSISPPNNPGMLKVVAVAGTPSATPIDPTNSAIQSAIGAANPYIILARVVVTANVTQITTSNITDLRTYISVSRAAGVKVPVQADTTNSTQTAAIIQTGWGQILGTGTTSMTKTVTFPVAVTTVFSLSINFLGYKSSGAAAAAITDFNTKLGAGFWIEPTGITTTGFTASFSGTSGFGAAYHGFSWTMIGA